MPKTVAQLKRQFRTRAVRGEQVNNATLAFYLLGPLHAVVCEVANAKTTACAIKYKTGLTQNCVDNALRALVDAHLVARRGLRYSWTVLKPDLVRDVFGTRRAASFMVYTDLAKKSRTTYNRFPRRHRRT